VLQRVIRGITHREQQKQWALFLHEQWPQLITTVEPAVNPSRAWGKQSQAEPNYEHRAELTNLDRAERTRQATTGATP
jgi:hypothetical protein